MCKLPEESGNVNTSPFEPNDEWLATASKELQIDAMRRWFLDRMFPFPQGTKMHITN